jgi:tetratricopeptide (TPR) repeat protein
MLHKLYIHGKGDFTIVLAAGETMDRVSDLLGHFAERWNTRNPAEPVDPSRLIAQLSEGGVKLEPARLLVTIPAKSDVFVSTVEPENDADRLKLEGNACLTAGKVREAIAKYTAAIQAAPEWPVPYLNRALAYLKLPGSLALAEQDARKAAALDPSNVKARYRIAQALFGLDKLEECHAELTRAMDMETVTPAQALDLGQLAQKCEERGAGQKGVAPDVAQGAAEARLPVAAFVRLKPYFDMAYEAMQQQSWGRAIQVYRSVLEIYPDDFTSLMGLAHCLLHNKSGKHDEAIPLLERLVRGAGTDDFGSWRLLAQARTEEGNFRAAQTALQRATLLADRDPNEKRRNLRRTDVLLGLSRASEHDEAALQQVSRVLLEQPEHPEALLRYGELMLRAGGEGLEEGLKVRFFRKKMELAFI